MNKIYLNRRLLSFLPALLLMIGIFCFSAQPADESTQISVSFSFHLIKSFLKFVNRTMTEADLYQMAVDIHGIVRKCAHFSEYAFLAGFLSIPCYIYKKKEFRFQLWILLTCFLYACTDEIHQAFVPGRACRFFDVCIDTSGAAASLLLICLFTSVFSFFHFNIFLKKPQD